MTSLTSSETRKLAELLFPLMSGEAKVELEEALHSILEGKDVGKFKGDISVYKQRALDIANSMPRSVTFRRGAEKSASTELDKLIDKLESDMLETTRRFREPEDSVRKISVTRLKSEMKAALDLAYRKAYDLGTSASGITRENPGLVGHTGADEKKFLDNIVKKEQSYFNSFLNDIIKGQSMTRAEQRIRAYANAVRSVFEASRTIHLPDDTLIYWVLQSSNPCSECRLLHRNSPYTKDTLPTTPKAGSTRCLAHCYCKLRVVKASQSELAAVARKNKSAENVLRQLTQSRKRK